MWREQRGRISDASSSLEPRQRFTLEIGALVVLAALGVGVQFGGWPAWSALVATSGYVCWVVAYAEATIQVGRVRLRRRGRARELAG